VLARARAETTDLALGVDANAAGMIEAATRAARKPSKGGAPNARFIVAAAEALPAELAATADLVTVQFPWGSLLRGIVRDEAGIVCALAQLLKPVAEAELRLLISVEARDRALGLAALDAHGVDHVIRSFRQAGLQAIDVRPASAVDLAAARSTWANRLRAGSAEREAWLLRFARLPS
jgi:16S rRNA (adenine(1408)-N(1))-methyltransferase